MVLAALMLCTCVAVHAMIAVHESNIAIASGLMQAAPGQVCCLHAARRDTGHSFKQA